MTPRETSRSIARVGGSKASSVLLSGGGWYQMEHIWLDADASLEPFSSAAANSENIEKALSDESSTKTRRSGASFSSASQYLSASGLL